jgi:hypothetical protein
MNLVILLATALIPLLIGAIWYNKSVFGNTWIRTAGMTEERLRQGSMIKIYGLTYLLSFFVAVILQVLVIHQIHMFSILAEEPGVKDAGSEVSKMMADFMAKYGSNFRTFKHGVFHGVIAGIGLASPIIGFIALYERRSFKYFAVHAGYWIVTMALMGGVLCQFMKYY